MTTEKPLHNVCVSDLDAEPGIFKDGSMHPGKFLKALEFPLLFKGLESSGNLMSASWKVLGFLCFKFDKFRLHFVRVQLKNYGHCLSAV